LIPSGGAVIDLQRSPWSAQHFPYRSFDGWFRQVSRRRLIRTPLTTQDLRLCSIDGARPDGTSPRTRLPMPLPASCPEI
jgi:hypothetical protein